MGRALYLENKGLAKKISERRRQIRVLAKQIAKAILAYGTILSQPPHKKKEEFWLGDYRLVTIDDSAGYHVTIYEAGKDICRLFWEETIEQCKVVKWEKSYNWYGPLTNLLGSKKKIARQLKLDAGADSAATRASTRAEKVAIEKERLKKEAAQLKV
jgi:hypothetical protein